MKAEYRAFGQAVKKTIWTKGLLKELAILKNPKTAFYIDNQSAIKLIKNLEFHQRSKHIDVRFNFIRDK